MCVSLYFTFKVTCRILASTSSCQSSKLFAGLTGEATGVDVEIAGFFISSVAYHFKKSMSVNFYHEKKSCRALTSLAMVFLGTGLLTGTNSSKV